MKKNIISFVPKIPGAHRGFSNQFGIKVSNKSKVVEILNQICDFAKGDRPLSSEIENVSDLINSNELAQHVSKYLRLE